MTRNAKRIIIIILSISYFFTGLSIYAQKTYISKQYEAIDLSYFESSARHWYHIYDKGNIIFPKPNQPRFKASEIIQIADNILLYQRVNGGWPKNYDMQAILSPKQKDSLIKTKNILHTTFDNSTTYTHIDYLSHVYSITKNKKYKKACIRGIDYILSAQYPNGGWPQYFPLENNYSRKITFNDNAMVGILELFKNILESDPIYAYIDNNYLKKINTAYQIGLDCTLNCQINENGIKTAWCQQHDEITLKPVWARAFEPPAISNYESASIVLFLMKIKKPDQRIKNAIQYAVEWFNKSKISNIRVDLIITSNKKITDRVVIHDSTAPPIWTRYYELVTYRPLFCDRNSKYLYSLAEVSQERRAGYGWYTYEPQEVINKYLKWKEINF